jgi:hypothetical protein
MRLAVSDRLPDPAVGHSLGDFLVGQPLLAGSSVLDVTTIQPVELMGAADVVVVAV